METKLAPVVRRLDKAIHRISRYPDQWISVNKTNHANRWIVIYPVDSVIHLSNNPGLVYHNNENFAFVK